MKLFKKEFLDKLQAEYKKDFNILWSLNE